MMNKKNGVRSAISLILIICMLASLLYGCSAEKTRVYSLSEETIKTKKSLSLSYTTTGATKSGKISSSGMTTLFTDRKTASPIIKNQDDLWRALPKSTNSSADDVPAVLTLEVLHEGQRYILNSQTDAVKLQNPVSRKTDKGVCTEYAFTLETGKDKAEFTVPVEFYVEDGSFFVSVICSDIVSTNSEFVITKMRLMDYFGSNTGASDGDFILVPDNSGAVIDTYNAQNDFENLSFRIYGDVESNEAYMPAFGMKHKDSAFIAMIEKGDAIATVNAAVAAHSGYNRVGAEFELTETMIKENGDNKKIYVSGETYKGEIRICYSFIHGNNANYSGMAIACREHLIRTGVLSADTVEDTGDLPFILTTTGDAGLVSGRPSSNLTNYEQLIDMLTYLKGKGFSNIYIRYKGTLTGAPNQNNISNCEPIKTLGSQEDFKELTEYLSAQQMKLFFDLGYTTASSVSLKGSATARDISGSPYSLLRTNLFGVTSMASLVSYDRIEENVISIFALAGKNRLINICVNDASSFLYSDSKSGATRTEVMEMLREENASLTTIGELMTEKGNFYMLKNVSVISSLPAETSVKESDCYKAVPFIELVLHGTTQYSTGPINLSSDPQTAMLKCVEYGALPQFEWCYEDITVAEEQQTEKTNAESGESEETNDEAHDKEETETTTAEEENTVMPYSYSDWATTAFTFYDKANRALGNIRDLRMTDHYEVQPGVFCTEYGESSVYVNYTDEDVTIGGVTIPANDFMRVN